MDEAINSQHKMRTLLLPGLLLTTLIQGYHITYIITGFVTALVVASKTCSNLRHDLTSYETQCG